MNRLGTRDGEGVLYGLLAYGLWGAFPLYFVHLHRSSPVEIVVHRVLWSLLVCLGLVVALQRGGDLLRAARSWRTVVSLTMAALVLALNWGIYVYAMTSGQVVQASLGYFINPLVTVLLGVAVLHERLRPAQWAAIGMGALAVGVITIDDAMNVLDEEHQEDMLRLAGVGDKADVSDGAFATMKQRLPWLVVNLCN